MEQIVSLAGAILILGAYAAMQFGFLSRNNLIFNLMNFVGALILAIIAYRAGQWGFVLLESVWAIVSIPPLFKTKTA